MDTKTELMELRERVSKNTDVIKSAVELIKGFKAKLDECLAHDDAGDGGDIGEDIQALSDELAAQTDALAAAVAENTGAVDSGGDSGGSPDDGGNGSEPTDDSDDSGSGDVPVEPVEPSEGEVFPSTGDAPVEGDDFEKPRE